MSDRTAISWTDATWNPVTGCDQVSPGCAHCYAKALSERFGRSFEVTLHPERLDEPLHWRKPRRVFVCSMSDLFHEHVPGSFATAAFAVMAATAAKEDGSAGHTFQVLTKRAERMSDFVGLLSRLEETGPGEVQLLLEQCAFKLGLDLSCDPTWPLPNVWLGVSIENARYAYRADILRQTPAAVRWISAEPLLGPLGDDTKGQAGAILFPGDEMVHGLDLTGIDWLVIGGESGPNYRPMELAWMGDLIAAADAAGTRVYVKQDSGRLPGKQGRIPDEWWARKEFPR